MSKHILIAGCVLAVAAANASAQQFVGFAFNTSVGATSRGSVGTNAGEIIARIDADDYAGWANDPANPAQRLISAVSFTVQDQDAFNTAELFDLKIYGEDPANPGYPLLSSGVTAVTGIAGPTSTVNTTLIVAAFHSVTFATPVPVPVGQDAFVSFAVPAAAWSTDGLSFHINLGYAPSASFLVWDEPGAQMQPLVTTGITPDDSYALNYIPTATPALFYSARRQITVDIATGGAGGCVTAITNQANYTISNAAPGTASFMSGLHPDATNPPYTAGRADDIGYRFNDASLPDNSVVFFLATLGTFGPELSLASIVPGSTGVGCLNPAFVTPLGVGLTATGTSTLTTTIPAGARAMISGFPLLQQAIGYNSTNGTLHAGPCGRQLF